jgi:tetratricopeptide (TPR) repeat protein
MIGGGTILAQDNATLSSGPYDANRSTPGPAGIWNIVSAPPVESASDAGTVSVNELSHNIPGRALREWDRAQKARGRGQIPEAVAHLKKAVEIDPEFVAAHNNVAAILLFENRPADALEHLQTCTKLDPHNAMAVSNMAVAYMMQARFTDAEEAARRGLDLDRTGNRVRLIYGLSQLMQDKFTKDAMQALQRAKDEFPQARLLEARIYAAWGRRDEALEAINVYLRSGESTGAELAKQWKAILEKAPRPVMAEAETAER